MKEKTTKEKGFDEAFAKLNDEQRKAVDTVEGPVTVIAGPGTGKTQILTLRIANILLKTDAKPENILALTFTNSGVYSMRKRLKELIGDTAYRVNIFTFHAFSEYLIKEFPFYFPQFEYSKVIDELEKVKIIEKILTEGRYENLTSFHDDFMYVVAIKKAIDAIKQEGHSPEQYRVLIPEWSDALFSDEGVYYKKKYRQYAAGDMKPSEKLKIENRIIKAQEVADIYEEYQKEITKLQRYDFSDMVLSVLGVLEKNEDFKYDVQEKYQYVLVDEHQDTNSGQNKLVEYLTDAEHLNGRPNIFTVGDEKQSIYRFQGASEETFGHFHSLFKDITTIALKDNYRSTQNILSGAHAVITQSMSQSQELLSHSKGNDLITIGGFANYKMELIFVANDIKEKISSGIQPEEIAIIFRSNKHVDDIKSVLAHKGIPFTIHAKSSVFDAIDIRNIVTLLRVIKNPHDEESLSQALLINFLKLDPYDVIRILNKRRHYSDKGLALIDCLASDKFLKEMGVENREEVIGFSEMIKNLIISANNNQFTDFLKEFLMKSGYTHFMLGSNQSLDKLMVIDKFFDEIKKQCNSARGHYTLEHCLTMIDAYRAYRIDIENKNPEIEGGIQLMTAHGSKGKEFQYVYIVNATRSQWEKSRGFGGITLPIPSYKGGLDDERRLFYVAMTRAKESIWITYSETDWEGKQQEKSQFIDEIPEDYVEYIVLKDSDSKYGDDLKLFLDPYTKKSTIYDIDFIKELYFKQGLNLTALNNYLECPLKYFYRNLVRLPSAYSPFLIYGNSMHESLEKFFLLSKDKEVVQKKDMLLSLFKNSIKGSDMNDADLAKYQKKGLEALSDYYDEYAKSWSLKVRIEESVSRDIALNNKEELRLTGKIDKIEYLGSELDGPIAIVDYKTGKGYSEKNKDNRESLRRQIVFYHMLLEDYRGGDHRIERATLDFIEKNKKGDFEQYTVEVSDQSIYELHEQIKEVSRYITSGAFLERGCGKKTCEWCLLHQQIKHE